MTPKVSVIMACHNQKEYLAEALESILCQSFADFELIVIDDGSTDESPGILTQFKLRDNRVQILTNNKNEGLAGSLNRGIRASRSDLIARMDCDDIAHPDRLKLQFSFLLDHPDVDILGSAITLEEKQSLRYKGIRRLPQNHDQIIRRVFRKTIVYHPTVMMRKKVFFQFGFYDANVRWAEDADLWYRIYDKVTFHNLREPLLKYRVKRSLSLSILKGNIKTKYRHLRKRNLLVQYFPVLIRDFFTLSVRLIYNY